MGVSGINILREIKNKMFTAAAFGLEIFILNSYFIRNHQTS